MIYVAGIGVAVLLEFLLLSKKNKSQSDKVLALWMFLISVHLFLYYLYSTGEVYNYPFLLGISVPFPLLQSVFLYLYVASVTEQLPAQRISVALHFLPTIAIYVYLIPYFLLPAEQKIHVIKEHWGAYETFRVVWSLAVGVSGVVYIAWSNLMLVHHRRRILDRFSYRHKIDLQWLMILTWGMGGIWLLVFLGQDQVIYAGVVVFVFLIGFFGIRQQRIFDTRRDVTPADVEKEKYARSGLADEVAERLYLELNRAMKDEAAFKKQDLSLDDLASRLKAHPNHLSQIINEKEGKNFYDFVNHYRLEEFKRRVADPRSRNFTLLSIAFDCGFNSKSSFNRHFKKVTGQTPSEYFAGLTRQ